MEGVGQIPTSGVAAVALDFTVLAPASGGYIHADADDASPSYTVTYLNFTSGSNQSNAGTVPVGADGKIQVWSTIAVDMIIDVSGYYTTGNPAAGGYVSITPRRVVDTRSGLGLPQAKLAAGSTSTIKVAGQGGVPTSAQAVMVNFEVLNPTGSSYFTPYASDKTQPTSSYAFPAITDDSGAQVALATSGSAAGSFNFFVHAASIDLAVDVVGYFTANDNGGGAYTTETARVLDTRIAPGTPISGGGTLVVPVAGVSGIPATNTGIAAITANIEVVDGGSTSSWLRAWANGATEPSPMESLRYLGAATTSNMVTSALGSGGAIMIRNGGTDSVNVVVDVEGWYQSPGSNERPVDTKISPVVVYDNTSSAGETFAPGATRQLALAGQGSIPSAMSSGLGSVDGQVTVSAASSGSAASVSPAYSSLRRS